VCSLFGRAEVVAVPADVPAWVWTLSPHEADAVLRRLVSLAQAGDQTAALTVIGCLRPGLCSLAGGLKVGMDEIVSEAALVLLRFSRTRRQRIAAGLLLDIRHRFWEAHKKAEREVPMGDGRPSDMARGSAGEMEPEGSAAGRLAGIVLVAWRAGYLSRDAAQLLIETRVYGVSVAEVAARLGISTKATYERRRRAEARLRRWVEEPARRGRPAGQRRLHGVSISRTTYPVVNRRAGRTRSASCDRAQAPAKSSRSTP
jgi:DNA-directed RNA polymerase specialized sigma24 family protein